MIGTANPVRPGAAFDAFADFFDTGLVGQISVSIYDQDDNLVFGPQTTGITEIAPIGDLARYGVTLIAPSTEDTYLVVWNDNEADPNSASEELIVSSTLPTPTTPSGWITADDLIGCCEGFDGSDSSQADEAVAAAIDVLITLTAGQFPGIVGPVIVRPQVRCWHDRGPYATRYSMGGYGYFGRFGRGSCSCLSSVTLAGIPVREIIAVKVDGAFLTSSEYRLDGQDLVRMRDVAQPRRPVSWPTRQVLDLPDTEDDTWAVTYMWGAVPPWQGIEAAKELACEIMNACDPDSDCAIPSGVVSIVRSGLTINRAALAEALAKGTVGLPMVDLFTGTYNPDKLKQRAAVWSPDTEFPYQPGT